MLVKRSMVATDGLLLLEDVLWTEANRGAGEGAFAARFPGVMNVTRPESSHQDRSKAVGALHVEAPITFDGRARDRDSASLEDVPGAADEPRRPHMSRIERR